MMDTTELQMLHSLVKEERRKAFIELIKWTTHIKTLSPGDSALSAALDESKKARENLDVYTQELKRINEELGSNP